jgi:hypothetical protein
MSSSPPLGCSLCEDGHCDGCCDGYCDGQESYPEGFFSDLQEQAHSFRQLNAMYAEHTQAAIAAAKEKARLLLLHPPPRRSTTGSTRSRPKRKKPRRWFCTGTLTGGGRCGMNGREGVMKRHLNPLDAEKHQAAGGCDGGQGMSLISPR